MAYTYGRSGSTSTIIVPYNQRPQIRRLYFRNTSRINLVVKLVCSKPHLVQLASDRLRLRPSASHFVEAKFLTFNASTFDCGDPKILGYVMPIYSYTYPKISHWLNTAGVETAKQLAFEMDVKFNNTIFSASDVSFVSRLIRNSRLMSSISEGRLLVESCEFTSNLSFLYGLVIGETPKSNAVNGIEEHLTNAYYCTSKCTLHSPLRPPSRIIIDLPGSACIVESVPKSVFMTIDTKPVDWVDSDTRTGELFNPDNFSIDQNRCWFKDLFTSKHNSSNSREMFKDDGGKVESRYGSTSQQHDALLKNLNRTFELENTQDINVELNATPCGGY